MGSGGGAVRIHRAAFVGALRQDRPANDRIARRHQHSVLRRDGAPNSLVAIQRLPNVSYTAWYIIVGEFGIALAFALLARTLRRDSWRVAVVAGVAGGASIFVCYAAGFLITDRLIS